MFLFQSTKGTSPALGFSEAMLQGLAPDGGLYVPERLPRIDLDAARRATDVPQLAEQIIAPFLDGDPLAAHLKQIVRDVFQIPLPVTSLDGQVQVLELFHGPTAAFKDFGAGFLAQCLAHSAGKLRLIVATSGDTGGAVAAACHGRPGLDVVILYPKGGVSACQEKQLTSWGDNVHAFALRGSFDACQAIVKQALAHNPWPGLTLTTANSISIARLVPQIVHHAVGALAAFGAHGRAVDFVIPSGNLGNASAALWAKRMGFPIARIHLACNANRVLADFLSSGLFEPRPSLVTLANAMDIGDPSNLVRVRSLYASHGDLVGEVSALSISDDQIQLAIKDCQRLTGRTLDPHTATAYAALDQLQAGPKLIVSTAHAAKFAEVVEPLVGQPIPVPHSLANLDQRSARVQELDANLGAVVGALSSAGPSSRGS